MADHSPLKLSFRFKPSLSDDEQRQPLLRFITDAVEARQLQFGGGETGFVTKAGRGSTTDADRQALHAWLMACAAVEQVVVGANRDAWHGWGAGEA